jgi:hypothetical protein
LYNAPYLIFDASPKWRRQEKVRGLANCAEIAAYDPGTQTLLVVSGDGKTIDLLDISDPTAPVLEGQIDVTEYGDSANSVAVYKE